MPSLVTLWRTDVLNRSLSNECLFVLLGVSFDSSDVTWFLLLQSFLFIDLLPWISYFSSKGAWFFFGRSLSASTEGTASRPGAPPSCCLKTIVFGWRSARRSCGSLAIFCFLLLVCLHRPLHTDWPTFQLWTVQFQRQLNRVSTLQKYIKTKCIDTHGRVSLELATTTVFSLIHSFVHHCQVEGYTCIITITEEKRHMWVRVPRTGCSQIPSPAQNWGLESVSLPPLTRTPQNVAETPARLSLNQNKTNGHRYQDWVFDCGGLVWNLKTSTDTHRKTSSPRRRSVCGRAVRWQGGRRQFSFTGSGQWLTEWCKKQVNIDGWI